MNVICNKKIQRCSLLGAFLAAPLLTASFATANVVKTNVTQAPDPDTGVMQNITVKIIEVPIPVTDSSNDAVLDDFVSYDFVVSSDEAIRTGSLKIEPRPGETLVIFNATSPPFNALIVSNLAPGQAAIDFDSAIAFDTYVNLPNSNPSDVSIIGRAVRDGVGSAVFGPDVLSAQWFVSNIQDGNVLDFTIARVTIRQPNSQANGAPSAVLPFLYHGFITTGDLGGGDIRIEFTNVPEPATVALWSVGGLLLMRRRRAA